MSSAGLPRSPLDGESWTDLARHYHARDLPWQAKYAARQALRCDPGLRPRLAALIADDAPDGDASDALLGRAQLPQAAELAAHFAAAVAEQPDDWLTWLYLARLHEMPDTADSERHRQALARAQALEAIHGETQHWLGVWRLNAGNAQGAVAALSGLLDVRPPRYGSMMYLGEALLRIGNIAAAEKAFTRASLSPNPDFLLTLSSRVYAHNYWQEAIAVLKKAIELRPEHVPTWLALAKIQSEVYELAGCGESLARIKALDPDNAEAALLDAGLKGRMGDAAGHFEQLRRAYAGEGNPLSRLASSIAMTALYQDELSPEDIARLHRELCAPIEASVTSTTQFQNDRNPERRLRIGYVTGDLHRQHPVNLFMLPVLKRHDHTRFEVCVYHTGAMHDEYTRQARACADCWLEAARLDDQALHRAILADQVDLLVDLAGHTSGHRLGVFALRAAPVQASFLGYPHSTGLSTIDWLIGDAVVSPAEHAHLFSEGIAQLPGSVFCWAPVDDYPLPPARPAEAPPVFGSFNNAMKLTPRTIELWAGVLKTVPGSRLLLKAPSLRDQRVRENFAQRFAAHGIDPARIEFRGPSELSAMMQEYGDIDIALDPVPYNGGTTSLQALWMGVPVIALAGNNFPSRMGASFLTTLGKPDWTADSDVAYLDAAVRLAAQLPTLRNGRAALRQDMQACLLSDIDAWTRNMENLYRRMWLKHCSNDTARLIAC